MPIALLLGAGALPRAWLRQACASCNNLLHPCKSGFLYVEGNAFPSNGLLLQKFAFMQIELIGVTSHTQNEVSKLAGKGKHALIWAGGTPLLSLLSVITFTYCTAALPVKLSWKLLPNSTTIWLFPHAQAAESNLSQTPQRICLLFSSISHTPGPFAAPPLLPKPRPPACSQGTSMSTTPPYALACHHRRGAGFQHYLTLSGLRNRPSAPQSFHGRNQAPFSSLPLSGRGRGLQLKPWAGGVMTAHRAASITCNGPASCAACQYLSTKRCQASARSSQTTLLPKPHNPCSGQTILKDELRLREASQLSMSAV